MRISPIRIRVFYSLPISCILCKKHLIHHVSASQPSSKLCVRRPVLVRSSQRISDAFSPSFMQTPPCSILKAVPCGADLVRSSPLVSTSLPQNPPCSVAGADGCGPILNNEGKLTITYDQPDCTSLDKIVPWEFEYNSDERVTIGPSHGWVATFNEDGILHLQDHLSPAGASYKDPKCIPLPPLVTLPHCQTQIVTNVAMSSSSPEDEDCVVAVKFLGPQISFCRPAQRKSGWTNIRIENTSCFFSSRVMFSKKDEMFRMPGSGGHLIASWDLHGYNPMFGHLCLNNLPKQSKKNRELMDACTKSEHLVESSTGETFLLKRYKKTTKISNGTQKEIIWMVFELDLVSK